MTFKQMSTLEYLDLSAEIHKFNTLRNVNYSTDLWFFDNSVPSQNYIEWSLYYFARLWDWSKD
jgi:hypothetical protein